MRIKITFLAIIGVVLFMISANELGLFKSIGKKPGGTEFAGKGLAAPPFTLFNLRGEKVDSSSFQGKVILLNFWATWCPPCREEIPYFNELHIQYKNDGLAVIGISLDRGGPEEVRKFLDKYNVEYLNLMGDEAVIKAYSNIPGMGPIQGIPTTFIIDRQGQIGHRFVGFTEKKVVEEAIRQFLKKT